MERLYRLAMGMVLTGLLVGLMPPAAFALDPDVSFGANGTGPNGATTHTLWSGPTDSYGAGEARFTWQLAPGATAHFRWTCNGGATGPTTTANGGTNGLTVQVRGSTYSAAQVEFIEGASYCAFSIWSTVGSFRVSNATMHFVWGDSSGGGTLPTPSPSPSPTPSPTPPPPSATYECVIVSGTCTDNDPDFAVTLSPGQVVVYSAEAVKVTAYGYVTIRLLNRSGAQLSGSGVYLSRDAPNDAQHFCRNDQGCVATSRTITSSTDWTDGGIGGIYVYNQSGDYVDGWTVKVWIESIDGVDPNASPTPTPTPTPEPGLDSDGDGYSDQVEAGAGTDPNDAGSYPGYELPDDGNGGGGGGDGTWGGQYDGGDIDGGGADGDDGTPGSSGAGSGIPECTTSDVTLKVGYQPYDDVPDTDDLGTRMDGKDPLDGLGTAVGWLGDMLWTIPNRIGNAIKWAVNTVVDFVVPGDCLEDIIEARMAVIQGEPPFSLFTQVNDLVSGSGAGSASLGDIPLPGGQSVALPFDALGDASGVRPVLVGIVWLAAALAILSLIAGTFGVKGTGE